MNKMRDRSAKTVDKWLKANLIKARSKLLKKIFLRIFSLDKRSLDREIFHQSLDNYSGKLNFSRVVPILRHIYPHLLWISLWLSEKIILNNGAKQKVIEKISNKIKGLANGNGL
ncbi:hypothetical protein B0187_06660 [Haemophilus paracuniculus]|uniref:Uncharacterized protein n=1 Tax=Haemophilus paracuniculus TaxID=734 RepID=A0A1T0ARG2_9PAST|nr:hypothetical protein B0187_06660 [Haemophilus paracuniculus]